MASRHFNGLAFDGDVPSQRGDLLQAGAKTRLNSTLQDQCSVLRFSQTCSVEPRA